MYFVSVELNTQRGGYEEEYLRQWEQHEPRQSGKHRKQQKEGAFFGAISAWEMRNKFRNITKGKVVKNPDCQAQDADSYLR